VQPLLLQLLAMSKAEPSGFFIESYELTVTPSHQGYAGVAVIKGRKIGRPSHRITLLQKGLKLTAANITYFSKKETAQKVVDRINHLNTFGEMRLHCQEMLYPGVYNIRLEFVAPRQSLENLKDISDETEYFKLFPAAHLDISNLKINYE
jgi:hypothetical protein